MKKKVLFALIALFSFVSSWAIPAPQGKEVTALDGNYKVTISDNVVLTGGDAPTLVGDNPVVNATTPTEAISDIEAVAYSYDAANKKLVAFDNSKMGYGILQVTFTAGTGNNAVEKTVNVPFTVGKSLQKAIYWNGETWDNAVKQGLLKQYYQNNPWYDLWDAKEKKIKYPDGDFNAFKGGYVAEEGYPTFESRYQSGSWLAKISGKVANTDNYIFVSPILAIAFSDQIGAYKVLYRHPDVQDGYLMADENNAAEFGGENGIKGAVHFNLEEIGGLSAPLNIDRDPASTTFGNVYRPNATLVEENLAANLNQATGGKVNSNAKAVQLIAVPAEDLDFKLAVSEDDIQVVYWTLDDENKEVEDEDLDHFTYNGNEQKAHIVVTVNGVELEEGVDYTANFNANDAGAYTNAGEWPITITGVDSKPDEGDEPLPGGDVDPGNNNNDNPQQGDVQPTSIYVFPEGGIVVSEVIAPKLIESTDYILDAADVVYWGTATGAKAIAKATLQTTGGQVQSFVGKTVKFVCLDEDASDEELISPNHVGTWEMRVYIAEPESAAAEPVVTENEKVYVADEFDVTQAILTVGELTIDMKYGQDYPEIGDQYSVVSGENEGYKPGDSRENVEIVDFGKAQPVQSFTEFPEAGKNFFYTYDGTPRAITEIDGVDYENYRVQVSNNYGLIRVQKGDIAIAVVEDNMSKVYGDYDPTFAPVIYNWDNEIVTEYPIPALADGEEEEELTEEEEAIKARELAEMQRIYAFVHVTREAGEDVGEYDFIISVDDEFKNNYNYTEEAGVFTIIPFDITPVAATATTPADNKDNFVITVTDTKYNGEEQNQKPTVKFYHQALGKWINLFENGVEVTPAEGDKPAVVGADYTLAWSGERTLVTRNTDTRLAEEASVVTVDAGDEETLNPNFIGQKSAKYAITPATLTITFASNWEKTYGDQDPANILNPTYAGLIEGDDPTAAGFWTTAPKFSREAGEDAGTYKIYAEKEGTKVVGTTRNYDLTSNEGKLTIKKAALTVTATPFVWVETEVDGEIVETKSYTITYGDDVDFEVTVNGYKNKTAGTTTLEIYDKNLLGEEGADADPFVAQAYTITNNGTSTAGKVDFTITGPEEIKNYTITYTNGNFNVRPNQDGLWLTIEPKAKTYGTADPELTFVATLDGEEVDLDDLYLEGEEKTDIVLQRQGFNTIAGSNAGQYNITFKEGPAQIGNYKVNYDNESGVKAFTINKATLFVKATVVYPTVKDKDGKDVATTSIAYGEPIGLAYKNQLPGFAIEEYKSHISEESGLVGSGLIDGDDFATVINEPIFNAAGQPGNTNCVNDFVEYSCDYLDELGVGKFTVSADGPDAKNYIIVYNDGVDALNVVAAELTLKPFNQTFDYATAGVDGEAYVTPFINDDVDATTINVVGAPLPGDVEIGDLVDAISIDGTSVGKHTITITPKASDKVTVKYETGEFTVTPLDEIHLAYANVDQALEDHKGIEMGKVYLPKRKLTAGLWYTFVLPFDFRVSELSNKMWYGVADVLDEEANDGNFHFVNTSGRIEANQPFLYKAEAQDEEAEVAVTADELAEKYFDGVTIADKDKDGNEFVYNDLDLAPFREDAAGNQFIGQYTGVALDEFAENERVFGRNKAGQYVFGTPTKAIDPTVAYLGLAAGALETNVCVFIQEANGDITTAIEGVDAEDAAEVAAEGWYTITGIKLEGKPATKGTYIYNGKVVYVK